MPEVLQALVFSNHWILISACFCCFSRQNQDLCNATGESSHRLTTQQPRPSKSIHIVSSLQGILYQRRAPARYLELNAWQCDTPAGTWGSFSKVFVIEWLHPYCRGRASRKSVHPHRCSLLPGCSTFPRSSTNPHLSVLAASRSSGGISARCLSCHVGRCPCERVTTCFDCRTWLYPVFRTTDMELLATAGLDSLVSAGTPQYAHRP